ncbi:hypothetical protein STEG23_013929 [Scotinomys teguina]
MNALCWLVFVNVTQARVTWEEGPSAEELLPPGCPVGRDSEPRNVKTVALEVEKEENDPLRSFCIHVVCLSTGLRETEPAGHGPLKS